MPYPMKKNQNLARSVAPHLPLPTTTKEANVSDRANCSLIDPCHDEVGYGKGEWFENDEGDMEFAPNLCKCEESKIEKMFCEHNNTEWVPAEPENNVGEDLFCLDCNESLPLEVDYERSY